MNRSIRITSGRRFHRTELKLPGLIRRNPSKSKWQSFRPLDGSLTLIWFLRDTFHLPNLQQRVRYGLTVSVQNPPANRHAIPFLPRALNIWSAQCGKPDRKERSNRL